LLFQTGNWRAFPGNKGKNHLAIQPGLSGGKNKKTPEKELRLKPITQQVNESAETGGTFQYKK